MVGIVPCAVEILNGDTGHATFTLPRLPERVGELPDAARLAAALGIDESDIGLPGHAPAIWSAGVPFGIVPLRNRAAVSRARPVPGAFDAAFGEAAAGHAFIYCAEPVEPTSRYHARMFAPSLGLVEDPATGSAAAAFAGAVMAAEPPTDGDTGFVIEQGDAMGRPSRITLGLVVENGALVRASIGGEAVLIMEGSLRA
jgi:trans-2,3-dihydro-3-hydroxyanthranilate isomerase